MSQQNQPASTSNPQAIVTSVLASHWRLLLVEGIVLIFLGGAAIVLPQIASLAVELFFGWLLLIGGGIGLVMTILARKAPGFWWGLASACVGIVAGALLLARPVRGIFSLTFVLAAFLFADGLLMIMFGVDHRRQLSKRWGWFVVNGIIDLILAAVVTLALSSSAVWVLGLVVGIDMLFGGWSLIAVALTVRSK